MWSRLLLLAALLALVAAPDTLAQPQGEGARKAAQGSPVR